VALLSAIYIPSTFNGLISNEGEKTDITYIIPVRCTVGHIMTRKKKEKSSLVGSWGSELFKMPPGSWRCSWLGGASLHCGTPQVPSLPPAYVLNPQIKPPKKTICTPKIKENRTYIYYNFHPRYLFGTHPSRF